MEEKNNTADRELKLSRLLMRYPVKFGFGRFGRIPEHIKNLVGAEWVYQYHLFHGC